MPWHEVTAWHALKSAKNQNFLKMPQIKYQSIRLDLGSLAKHNLTV
jgi:hypothetical protein